MIATMLLYLGTRSKHGVQCGHSVQRVWVVVVNISLLAIKTHCKMMRHPVAHFCFCSLAFASSAA